MAIDIKIKRGTHSQLPTLGLAEPGFTTDTKSLYIGDGVGNVKIGKETLLDLTDTPSMYNTGKYLRSTAVGTEWADSGAFSGVSSENIIYIAKNGNDVTASGTFNDPFLTIKYAISTVSGCCDEANRYVFKVSPGIFYEDNPLQMEVYTQIVGEGGFFSTKIVANNINESIIKTNNATEILNFELNGSTGASAILTTVSGVFSNKFLVISNCQKGLYINNKDALIRFSDVNYVGNLTDAVLVESGYCDIKGLYVKPGAAIESVIRATGADSRIDITSLTTTNSDITNCFYGNNQSVINSIGGIVDNCTNVFRLNNASTFNGSNIIVGDNTVRQVHIENKNCTIGFIGCVMDAEKMFGPENYKGDSVFFKDSKTKGITVYTDLSVGRPDRSWSSVFGGGRSYSKGMVVLSTDSTASTISDGDNFIDITDEATTISGADFSFQGTSSGHSVLVGAAFTENLQLHGVKFNQISAAIEVTKRSFVTEYWNGTNWLECTNMCTESNKGYSYANELFIRSNSDEYISCNIPDDCVNKTINGITCYWIRFKIKYSLTTLPVFSWLKLQTNRTKFNTDGFSTFYGKAKFKQTVLATGNIFGETGGVTNAYVNVGFGGVPTGWGHMFKNNQLNSNGDAIYMQINLPRGICTAFPITVKIMGHPEQSGSSSNGTIVISVLPIEIQGVLEADPDGGNFPVERTLENTEVLTANAAQTTNISVPFVVNNKLITIESDPINISNYYEGDMLAIRIELDDDGTGNKDFIVWTVEVSGVKWTHGERV